LNEFLDPVHQSGRETHTMKDKVDEFPINAVKSLLEINFDASPTPRRLVKVWSAHGQAM